MLKEKGMIKKTRFFSLALVILAVIGISCSNQKGGGKPGGASAQAEQRIGIVKRGNFQERISATGNLEALVEVEV